MTVVKGTKLVVDDQQLQLTKQMNATTNLGFLSVVSKAAAVALSIRVLYYLFDFVSFIWQPMIVLIAILSMLVGNLVALAQVQNKSSIKRLMAYSSIAQIGYILIGVALATPETSGITSNHDGPEPPLGNAITCPKCSDDGQMVM